MAATGKTPILLYGSTTATKVPVAGNLTNSADGCEIAINVADKNLFFKDSTNVVNTVPIRQSSASSNGWLSSTDWSTFNGKAPAVTYTTSYIPYGQGTTIPALSSSLQFNGSQFSVNQTTLNEGGITPAAWVKQSSDVNFKGLAIRDAGAGGEVLHTGYDGTKFVTTITYLNAGGAYKAYGISVNGNETVTFDTSLNLNVNYGNLVIGTSGKGIDFSATPGTGTSELLADYEEGDWTPAQGAGLTVVGAFSSSGKYTKIGRIVTVRGTLTAATSITGSSGGVITNNLPFNSEANYGGTYFNAALSAGGVVDAAGANVYAVGAIAATTSIYFTATYFV